MNITPVFKAQFFNNAALKPAKTPLLKTDLKHDTISFSKNAKTNASNPRGKMKYANRYLAVIDTTLNCDKAVTLNHFSEFLAEADIFFDDEILHIAQELIKRAIKEKSPEIAASYFDVIKTIKRNYDCADKIDYDILKKNYSKISDENVRKIAGELINSKHD